MLHSENPVVISKRNRPKSVNLFSVTKHGVSRSKSKTKKQRLKKKIMKKVTENIVGRLMLSIQAALKPCSVLNSER